MSQPSAASTNLRDVMPGAEVGHESQLFGSVEEVVTNERGEVETVLIRHGRADYLLRVPAEYLRPVSSSRVEIEDGVELDELERSAVQSGRAPPTGDHIVDGEATRPSPQPEGAIGTNDGMPDSYDGPATA